ncbi:MAG: hypothetical protein EPN97_18070 [Alphaproteobacteria bacterium]|nr:MAG: hypothetical protein EPN97_18070 [Alphaproteobacteria bacterium]
MQEDRLEGRSLSLCIRDIIDGKVAEENVSRIVTSARAPDKASFEELIADYAESYWDANPEEGKAVARRFYEAGKIDQPRLRGEPYSNISDGCWKVIEYAATAETPVLENWGRGGIHDTSFIPASDIAGKMKADLLSAIENGVPNPKTMRPLKFKGPR